jgi:hypothetical protein
LDDSDIPLYKIPGPRLVLILIGLFFFGLFVGGFYWETYFIPTMHGRLVVAAPGKYLVMAAFLLFSFVATAYATPLCHYKKFLTYTIYTGFILYIVGSLVLSW